MKNINKKLLIAPVLLLAGIVITSVLTTGTNIATQSVYRDKAELTDSNQALVEKIEMNSSLKGAAEKVTTLGFVQANIIRVNSTSGSLSMASQ